MFFLLICRIGEKVNWCGVFILLYIEISWTCILHLKFLRTFTDVNYIGYSRLLLTDRAFCYCRPVSSADNCSSLMDTDHYKAAVSWDQNSTTRYIFTCQKDHD